MRKIGCAIVLFMMASLGMASLGIAKEKAPDLDLTIHYYSKVLTAEGVTREAKYQDTMMRRADHVWMARVLPPSSAHAEHETSEAKKAASSAQKASNEHQHFNHVVIPRHISLVNKKLSIEFIDAHQKVRISIPSSEYENVNFDGRWETSFFLLDPQILKTMKLSKQVSNSNGAVWYEREQGGVFQKVLWNEQMQIPLVIESGDRAGSFYRRVEVKLSPNLQSNLPWLNLKGFVNREYADYLD